MIIDQYTDKEIVAAILRRDTAVTKEFLYRKCYPLFCAVYNKYYTDCENPTELINEIYVYILTPKRDTGKCKLSDFGFRCTLTMWLKIVTEHFAHQLFKKRLEIVDTNEDVGDRKKLETISPNIDSLNRQDVEVALNLMPNKRYSSLIRYRYVEEKSNEETANILGMSMDNYYNKHKLAKEQFAQILRKEGLI